MATQSNNGKVYDMKEIISRYANDVIATCVFGINLDLMKDPNNEFLRLGMEAFKFNVKMLLKFIIIQFFSMLARLLRMQMFNNTIRKFFKKIICDTVKMKKEKAIVQPDMIQLMLEHQDQDDDLINIDDIFAQAFFFFIGGFDTVSTSLCFLIHEIGVNTDIQSKLQAEINHVSGQW